MMLQRIFCGDLRNIYVPLVKSKCYNVTVTSRVYAFVSTIFGCICLLLDVAKILHSFNLSYLINIYVSLIMLQCQSSIS